jgi:serine/threonine protein kinase
MEENPKESFKKRYSILNRISEGNFGCVYKAMDNQTSTLFTKIPQ